MPKLLQLNASLNKGSTGRIAEQIASLARSRGWEAYMVHGARYVNVSEMIARQVVTPLGEKLHAVKSMLFDAHGLGSTLATRRVIEEIENLSPDIIHLHNIHGYYINYKVLFEYLRSVDIPVVWTLHDCWAMTGHCAWFDSINCERWKTGCYSCPLKGEYPKTLLLERSKRNYMLKKGLFASLGNMTIVPVSQWLEDIVKESILKGYPCHVINNGIDISVFSPLQSDLRSELGVDDKTVLLGVASIWEERKGLQDFIKLAETLPDMYRIILIGVSDSQCESLPNNVIGVTRTDSQKELAEYYSMADVFVNPTYSDNFPTTNLEALACGTPIVTYRTGGSPESVTEETGLVVDKGDFDALVKAIEEVRAKGKTHYSHACRQRAVALYNKDDRYEDYIKLYESLLLQ